MKILVDKLPNKPQDCPHARFKDNAKGYCWYGCSIGQIVCEVDKKDCPFYTDMKTIEMQKKRSDNNAE